MDLNEISTIHDISLNLIKINKCPQLFLKSFINMDII
jgi:hypothetical protein